MKSECSYYNRHENQENTAGLAWMTIKLTQLMFMGRNEHQKLVTWAPGAGEMDEQILRMLQPVIPC